MVRCPSEKLKKLFKFQSLLWKTKFPGNLVSILNWVGNRPCPRRWKPKLLKHSKKNQGKGLLSPDSNFLGERGELCKRLRVSPFKKKLIRHWWNGLRKRHIRSSAYGKQKNWAQVGQG